MFVSFLLRIMVMSIPIANVKAADPVITTIVANPSNGSAGADSGLGPGKGSCGDAEISRVFEVDAVLLSVSVTERDTLKDPDIAYVWRASSPLLVRPSPKFQL